MIIHGGADVERYRPDPKEARSGVLFVGRPTPHEGVDRLIEALPLDAHLTIAGSRGHDPHPPESDYPRLLMRLASGRAVTFGAALSDHDLALRYRHQRVLVLPSVRLTCYGRNVASPELLGPVLLEAMASGTPVVATHVGGAPGIVQHGITGYLVESGNVPELRQRLAELLANPRLADRMGRNGRDLVVSSFTWKHVEERCLSTYQTLFP